MQVGRDVVWCVPFCACACAGLFPCFFNIVLSFSVGLAIIFVRVWDI